MGIPDISFISEHKVSFLVFRIFGLLPSQLGFAKTTWQTCIILFFSRLCWFLWHVLGTCLGIWNWYLYTYPKVHDSEVRNSNTDNRTMTRAVKLEEQTEMSEIFLRMSGLIFVLMVIGPLQSNVIKRNMDFFPRILKNIKRLEAIQLPKKQTHKTVSQEDLLHDVDIDSIDERENEDDIERLDHRNCCTNCYDKNLLPKISVGIFMTIFLLCFLAAAFKMHDMEDLMDEWQLILMIFFLPLPVLTTCFCIVLINQISKLYNELYDLKPEAFTDSKELMRISDYVTILQRTVEIMRNEIFEFTLGLNLLVFVTIGTVSMYEIIQGFEETKKSNNESKYAEIDYLIPLLISVLCIYKICSASDNLTTNAHERLLLRIKEVLSKHLFVKRIFEGNPHKKIKHLYENLKDWPPQVYIYGGWKIDFQLFATILILMFTYAKLFYDME